MTMNVIILKVLCDEIFDRRNFVANVIWQKRTSPEPESDWALPMIIFLFTVNMLAAQRSTDCICQIIKAKNYKNR